MTKGQLGGLIILPTHSFGLQSQDQILIFFVHLCELESIEEVWDIQDLTA